jgi:hypothetical protein
VRVAKLSVSNCTWYVVVGAPLVSLVVLSKFIFWILYSLWLVHRRFQSWILTSKSGIHHLEKHHFILNQIVGRLLLGKQCFGFYDSLQAITAA